MNHGRIRKPTFAEPIDKPFLNLSLDRTNLSLSLGRFSCGNMFRWQSLGSLSLPCSPQFIIGLQLTHELIFDGV
jgi:hypothetical protein